jgi:hypothetical protein
MYLILYLLKKQKVGVFSVLWDRIRNRVILFQDRTAIRSFARKQFFMSSFENITRTVVGYIELL